MNDVLKQRLVGALILLALAVVFWPIIFVEPGERYVQEQGSIPPPPDIDTTVIESPDSGGLRGSQEWEIEEQAGLEDVTIIDQDFTPDLETEAPAEPVRAAAAVRARTEAPVAPALDDQGLPVAWILQVATVSNAAKADELRDQLLAMKEKAYVKSFSRGGKDLYRVCIGPNFERARLESVQAGIDSHFGVKSMIVRYVP